MSYNDILKGHLYEGKRVLKSLEQHNKEAVLNHEKIHRMVVEHRNGIACPNCGEELIDSKPDQVLASLPPKKNISCTSCGYSGYRII